MGPMVKGQRIPSAESFRVKNTLPSESGWKSRAEEVRVQPGQNGIVASVRGGGPFCVVYAAAPAAWAAATVELFGVVGSVRVSLAGPVAVGAGSSIPIAVGEASGGVDQLQLVVAGAPPFVPAVPVPPLRIALVNWDSGAGFWDARFVALLERLESIEVLLKKALEAHQQKGTK